VNSDNGTDNLFQIATTTNQEIFVVNSNGRVGIGTTTPGDLLTVAKDQNAPSFVTASNYTNDTLAYVGLAAQSATSKVLMMALPNNYIGGGGLLSHFANRGLLYSPDAAGLDLVSGVAAGDIRFYTGGIFSADEKIRITSAGLVGIGTTTPWAKLSVAGSSLDSTTPLFTVSSSTPTGTTTVFHITSQGRVGIGTTAPTSQLTQMSTLALESAPLGSELTDGTGWTSTDWTGDYTIGFTHNTNNFNDGVLCSSYKKFATMQEKVQHQMGLVEKIRAADTSDTA